jgi:hypothetical protein
MRLLLALAPLLLVAACGGGNDRTVEWGEPWVDGRGSTVHEHVVSTYPGADHCEWESAVFLHLGWPLGTKEKINAGRQYVRDPKGLFPEDVSVPLDLDATLPADASYTGYHRGEAQLWLSASEAKEAVFIVQGNNVERWPRTTETIACA